MESTSNCPKRRSRFIGGLAALSALIVAAPVFAGVPCTGDLNGDGGVNTVDLGILLGDFGCVAQYDGPCAVVNPNGKGLPGCEADLACEAIICPLDPFCCDTEWDGICADDAVELCEATPCVGDINDDGLVDTTDLGILLGDFGCTPELFCGSQFAGSCCEANGTPFCDDAACCELICANDPFCCDTEWDQICADDAIDDCENCFECGSALSGSCCEANGTPFCDNAQCCETVCAEDPFCCNSFWDGLCAEGAAELCGSLCVATGACCLGDGTCQEGTEEQCANNDGTYQGDGTTCDDVDCPQPPAGCGDPDAGSCCEANGTPFCDEAACCEAVCAGDPFCCDTEWDSLCADDALELCIVCGAEPACGIAGAGSCCDSNGSPFCDNAACCETVCAADPFCCDNTWDGICADAAALDCGTLCAP